MGRPRTIHIDPTQLLTAVVRAWAEDLAAITEAVADSARPSLTRHRHLARLASEPWGVVNGEKRDLEELGVRIDFPRFAGRQLTDSERIRWQQALRGLESQGLVELYGYRATRVKPTAAGIARVEGKPDA